MLREIVLIDEEKCDGCGLCVPACAEGALKIIDGKAKVVADVLCDGLGACLGHCPQDAIRIEKREAIPFDEAAVANHLHAQSRSPSAMPEPARNDPPPMCPSARMARFDRPPVTDLDRGSTDELQDGEAPSELGHWPVKLRLLPPGAPMMQGAHLLVAADCVPVAYADFHRRMLKGRSVVIACPKFDDTQGYVEKLTHWIEHCNLADITVVHMEVPCCTGLLMMVQEARRLAGKDIKLTDIVVGLQGEIVAQREGPVPLVGPVGISG